MKDAKEAIRDLTLMLLYLNSWEEGRGNESYRRSWKGYDFDTLNELSEEGLIYDGRRSKSVEFDERGIKKAKDLLAQYGISE